MLVFVLLGLAVSCAVYGIWPTVYEAKSVFTKDVRPSKGDYDETCNEMEWYSDNYGELFEQKRSGWRSKEFFSRVIRQFRGDFPGSTVTRRFLQRGILCLSLPTLFIALTHAQPEPENGRISEPETCLVAAKTSGILQDAVMSFHE